MIHSIRCGGMHVAHCHTVYPSFPRRRTEMNETPRSRNGAQERPYALQEISHGIAPPATIPPHLTHMPFPVWPYPCDTRSSVLRERHLWFCACTARLGSLALRPNMRDSLQRTLTLATCCTQARKAWLDTRKDAHTLRVRRGHSARVPHFRHLCDAVPACSRANTYHEPGND